MARKWKKQVVQSVNIGQPPEGMGTVRWQTVLRFAKALIAKQGYVTSHDLIEHFDLAEDAACRYLDTLISQPGWDKAIVPPPWATRPGRRV